MCLHLDSPHLNHYHHHWRMLQALYIHHLKKKNNLSDLMLAQVLQIFNYDLSYSQYQHLSFFYSSIYEHYQNLTIYLTSMTFLASTTFLSQLSMLITFSISFLPQMKYVQEMVIYFLYSYANCAQADFSSTRLPSNKTLHLLC